MCFVSNAYIILCCCFNASRCKDVWEGSLSAPHGSEWPGSHSGHFTSTKAGKLGDSHWLSGSRGVVKNIFTVSEIEPRFLDYPP